MLLTVIGTDGGQQCRWAAVTPEFPDYHDREWGWPVVDDRMLFEKMCVENFQSGLSWRTILAKRENFRAAFAGFDFRGVANFDDNDIERLLADEGIVRYRGKIEAVINNARRTFEVVQEEGSFAAFIWLYEPCQGRRTATNAVQINSVRDPFQRPTKAWLQIRGIDHRICIHKGHGIDHRSRRRLLDAKRTRNSP